MAPIVIFLNSEPKGRLTIGETNHDFESAKRWLSDEQAKTGRDTAVLIVCEDEVVLGSLIEVNEMVRATHDQVFIVSSNGPGGRVELITLAPILKSQTLIELVPSVVAIPTAKPSYQGGRQDGLYVDPPADLIERLKSAQP